jgi:hypothetical protein
MDEEEDEEEDYDESEFSEELPGGLGARLVSCLAIMRHDASLTGDEPAVKSPKGAVPRGPRPPAGITLAVGGGARRGLGLGLGLGGGRGALLHRAVPVGRGSRGARSPPGAGPRCGRC